jgi:hypothetical protein
MFGGMSQVLNPRDGIICVLTVQVFRNYWKRLGAK